MFLFRLYLSLMTSWANDSFSAFTAIKSSSLIYFSLNLQSPIQFKALLLPYPSVRPLTAGSTWSREGCWYAPRIPLSLPSVGICSDRTGQKKKQKDKYFLPGSIKALFQFTVASHWRPPMGVQTGILVRFLQGDTPCTELPNVKFAACTLTSVFPSCYLPPWLPVSVWGWGGLGLFSRAAWLYDTSQIAQVQGPSI